MHKHKSSAQPTYRIRKMHHNSHTSTRIDAIVIHLQETFKEIRNEKFDRFQFFRCTENPGESLEQIHSRIKQKVALCNWEDLEDS